MFEVWNVGVDGGYRYAYRRNNFDVRIAIAAVDMSHKNVFVKTFRARGQRIVQFLGGQEHLEAGRYFIGHDQSSHKYLVPCAQRAAWDAWTAISEDDERSWQVPSFATEIGGGPLTFSSPMVRGQRVSAPG
jgi:hypothetical protein